MPQLTLIVAVLLTATLSGTIGMGGGVILVAIMAALMEPATVVPIHGVIQLVSNSTRSIALLPKVAWWVVGLYAPTLFLGAWLGLQLYSGTGMPWFRPLIGGFVIAFLVWEQMKPKRLRLPRWTFVPAGLGGGVLTILIGASGPYLAAFFLRDDLDREQIVATKAAIQTIGHLIKIPAFLSVGFSYVDHLELLVPLIACAIAGTLIGTRVLKRMGERGFRIAFRAALWILALRLIVDTWV